MRLSNSLLPAVALAHGRLMEPPGRSSLYQFPSDPDIAAEWNKIVPNYNDHELFCGGFAVQVSNGYKERGRFDYFLIILMCSLFGT